jgi:iron complex transport system permease protein
MKALTLRWSSAMRGVSPASVVVVLLLAAAAAVAVFLFGSLTGAVGYILPRRALKVGAMVAVAAAVGVSTLIFQTVTANRVLTPSIMGLDALYVLVQTVLVFTVGAHAWGTVDELARFGLEAVLLVGFSLLLYGWLLSGRGTSLHVVLLVGIVAGTLFRGISGLIQRLIDPNDFLVLQDLFFASFNQVSPRLLWLGAVIIAICAAAVWRMRRTLDVLALGRDVAVNLGVPYRRSVMLLLMISSVLVGVSTALVGPVTFFGLLVVSLAYQVCRQFSHAWLLPIVTLIGIVALVGGQLLLERVLGFRTPLAVIIEFLGGLTFLLLILKGNRT